MTPEEAILMIAKRQGEAAIITISVLLQREGVKLPVPQLENILDRMVASGLLTTVESRKTTFYVHGERTPRKVVKGEKKPRRKQGNHRKPTPVQVSTNQQAILALTAQIQALAKRQDDLLTRAEAMDDKIKRLTELRGILLEQEQERTQKLRQIKNERRRMTAC